MTNMSEKKQNTKTPKIEFSKQKEVPEAKVKKTT